MDREGPLSDTCVESDEREDPLRDTCVESDEREDPLRIPVLRVVREKIH